jgi:hypothetical protein
VAVDHAKDCEFRVGYVEKDQALTIGEASDAAPELATVGSDQPVSGKSFDLAVNVDKETVGSEWIVTGNIVVVCEKVRTRRGRPYGLPALNSPLPFSAPQRFS